MTEPLDSLVVADLCAGIPGGYASKLFADAGATVIMGEPPGGSRLRNATGPGQVGLFEFLAQGKASAVLHSWDDALDLVRRSDVVFEDSLSQQELAQIVDQGGVVTSITPFGRTGPYADRSATELTVQAESGCLATRGDKSSIPFQAGGHIVEWVTGSYAAAATLAAHRGHRAEHIDVSMLEVAALTGTNFQSVLYQLAGEPNIIGPVRVIEAPEIHPSTDGWVGFTTNSGQQFQDFLLMIDRAELIEDEELASARGRQLRLEEFRSIVNDWTSKRTTEEIVELASAFRIPVAPVLDGRSVLEFGHFKDRGVFVATPSGVSVPRRPWRMDDQDPPTPRGAPTLGDADLPGHRTTMRSRPSGLPLAGMRVIDLTAWWAGPTATHLLASLGAETIHIESPKRPDGMRMTGGQFRESEAWWERSSFFLTVNTNKSDLAIDLTSDEGHTVLLELVRTADVVIENYTPRVLDFLGLGWDRLSAENPRCSLVRMPAFGLSGPWRDAPGFAQTMEQVSGLAWLTGFEDSQPRNQRGPTDPNGGVHAAFGALLAMAARDRDGVGHHVESTFVEVALNSAAQSIIEAALTGEVQGRVGNRDVVMAPQGLYVSEEDEVWVAISVATDDQWQRLLEVIGSDLPPAWHASERMAHHDEIDTDIERWTRARRHDAVVGALVELDVPVGAVRDPRLIGTHPQLLSRDFFERSPHPVVGDVAVPTLPFRFTSVARWLRRPAPVFGQDNAEILSQLGYRSETIDEFARDGVIASRPVGL